MRVWPANLAVQRASIADAAAPLPKRARLAARRARALPGAAARRARRRGNLERARRRRCAIGEPVEHDAKVPLRALAPPLELTQVLLVRERLEQQQELEGRVEVLQRPVARDDVAVDHGEVVCIEALGICDVHALDDALAVLGRHARHEETLEAVVQHGLVPLVEAPAASCRVAHFTVHDDDGPAAALLDGRLERRHIGCVGVGHGILVLVDRDAINPHAGVVGRVAQVAPRRRRELAPASLMNSSRIKL